MKNLDDTFRSEAKKAAEIMRKGGIILYPTDTIWGIGCDATNEEAVQRIFRLKERADSKSMLVLTDSEAKLQGLMDEVPEMAWDLIELTNKPLTIIYPAAKGVAPSLIAEDGTLGIRVTREPFSTELCRLMRVPVVSTSANKSGQPTAQTYAQIAPEIIEGVDYVVECRRQEKEGQPSAIIRLGTKGEVEVLRQ
ncbi:L-threonylcarbamoyladenylate synthase [Porphyromonas loveana]|uniref:L-threonylcarbamoyladenylate synthase n=2 Tax=Porphyromonas loveana TaxID=1884669 RepID=UPI00359FB87C